MTKDVDLHSSTWSKMKNALGNVTETTGTYSSTGHGAGYHSSYSGGVGFGKRIANLVKVSEKVKRLIQDKDTDGVVTYCYHDDSNRAKTLQEKLVKLNTYANNVEKYIKNKIDQPFYEAMDKIGDKLEALTITKYTTTNTVGFKRTERVADARGNIFHYVVSPKTITIEDLYQVDNPYKKVLKASYQYFKNSDQYEDNELSEDDYLMAMLHTRAFQYNSLNEKKQGTETRRDLALSAGVIILSVFCPPAGAVAGVTLVGAEVYSTATGKDWGTGRELDGTERGVRAAFAVVDLIPGIKYMHTLAKTEKIGGTSTAKAMIKQGASRGFEQGLKNIDSFKDVLKDTRNFGHKMITQLDTKINNMLISRGNKLNTGLKHVDNVVSEAAQNFRLNVGMEPQFVNRVKATESKNVSKITNKLDEFTKLEPSYVGDVIDNVPIADRLKNIKSSVKETIPSEKVNQWWSRQGYSEPPYSPKSSVQILELLEDTSFVRVYDGKNSRLHGGWLMKLEDIKGLTPLEIQEKFALPHRPKFIGEVIIPKGSVIRVGEANSLFGFKGGGVQFDLMGKFIGEFREIGLIE